MLSSKTLRTLGASLFVIVAVALITTPSARAQSNYRTLYKFKGAKDGSAPYAGLIFDRAGNLYGTTEGIAPGAGVVFELTPKPNGRWTEHVLHTFKGGEDGAQPGAGLVFDGKGNLYGTTLRGGGACYCGVIFELIPSADGGWKEKVLHRFAGGYGDGSTPTSDLIFDAAGNIYGTTTMGGPSNVGTVFELTPNSNGHWTESVLYYFNFGIDGWGPMGGVISDGVGNLYGTTYSGGIYNWGTVFELSPNSDGTWTETVLQSFENEGAELVAGLIFDAAGNLYGTAPAAVEDTGYGIAFELTPHSNGTWTESVLYRFCSIDRCPDGASPAAGLTFDHMGNLYGTTVEGGDANACGTFSLGCGVVFKLAPNPDGGWKETVVHHFLNHPGAFPVAGLVLDSAGNLYGTTTGDDHTTFGSVFEITP